MKTSERAKALVFTRKLASEVGVLLNTFSRKLYRQPLRLIDKGASGMASEADLKAEELVIKRIRKTYPAHGIMAEEDTFKNDLDVRGPRDPEQLTWLIDPLDGTNNFLNGLPFYCVSLALVKGREVQVGVVHNPVAKETFYATKGGGAFLERQFGRERLSKKLKISRTSQPLHECLISTNLGSKRHNASLIRRFPEVRAFRRLGSAALELSYVAGGMLDAYWEYHLQPWDIAAGGLICQEASIEITDLRGQAFDPFEASVLAARSPLYGDLLEILQAK
jgi:myo-inositol-1(or 4)-monophosphatase